MSLTRDFNGNEIILGIKLGIVSKDVLMGGRPVTFDERLRLEKFLGGSNVAKKN